MRAAGGPARRGGAAAWTAQGGAPARGRVRAAGGAAGARAWEEAARRGGAAARTAQGGAPAREEAVGGGGRADGQSGADCTAMV